MVTVWGGMAWLGVASLQKLLGSLCRYWYSTVITFRIVTFSPVAGGFLGVWCNPALHCAPVIGYDASSPDAAPPSYNQYSTSPTGTAWYYHTTATYSSSYYACIIPNTTSRTMYVDFNGVDNHQTKEQYLTSLLSLLARVVDNLYLPR